MKPWGTGHAVLSCAEVIDGPFVVINADDYYGTHAFKMAYDFLAQAQEDTVPAQYMMVGYRLENTLTDNGYVSRGVCETDADGYLADINERTHIEKRDGGAAYRRRWKNMDQPSGRHTGIHEHVGLYRRFYERAGKPFSCISPEEYSGESSEM